MHISYYNPPLLYPTMAETEAFSIEAVIFVFILLIYVLTSHFIEIRQVRPHPA